MIVYLPALVVAVWAITVAFGCDWTGLLVGLLIAAVVLAVRQLARHYRGGLRHG